MPITRIRVKGFRSIEDSGPLELGRVTLVLGPNNSGKSSLLRGLYLLQVGSMFEIDDFRIGHADGQVMVAVELTPEFPGAVVPSLPPTELADVTVRITFDSQAHDREGYSQRIQLIWNDEEAATDLPGQLSATRPSHLFVPVLSGRRTDRYDHDVRADLSNSVSESDRSLTSRVVALGSPQYEAGRRFQRMVREVLEVPIGTFLAGAGQQPGMPISQEAGVSLIRMGEGIRGTLRLLSELAPEDSGRVFLVEEPENDLHPRALQSLLDLIALESANHQFVISTHSDLVLRRLGSLPETKIYRASAETVDGVPRTAYSRVNTTLERLDLLADLGYHASLPSGWLIFEESTAERLCKDLLIPRFVPALAALQTVSTRGVGNVPAFVQELWRLVLFAHLTDGTTPRAWVIVDGGKAGRQAIERLHTDFATWSASRFTALGEVAIEHYYPARFRALADAALAEKSWDRQRKLKGALVEQVISAAAADPAIMLELAESSGPVIEVLKAIAEEFRPLPA